MKKISVIAMLALVLAFGSTASAFAASYASYNIVAPRFRADAYTSEKTVNARQDFGVRHKYSGNYPIRFMVCNTSKQPIGSLITVYPGGSSAGLVDLWYNNSASARKVVVRMDSSKFNRVRILCSGTWVWNY